MLFFHVGQIELRRIKILESFFPQFNWQISSNCRKLGHRAGLLTIFRKILIGKCFGVNNQFHHIFQFPHIAGERMALQHLKSVRRQRLMKAVLVVQFGDEMLDQGKNIISAFSQRRDLQRIEPEQALAILRQCFAGKCQAHALTFQRVEPEDGWRCQEGRVCILRFASVLQSSQQYFTSFRVAVKVFPQFSQTHSRFRFSAAS